jgi:hypothetical protein
MFNIKINGRPVAYLKRVKYGEPMVIFTTGNERPAPYSERVAKGWLNTCRQFWDNVEMVPAEEGQRH